MKIVVLTETYAPTMGYLPTMLSKHLARLGCDVHLVTLDRPPSGNLADAGDDFRRATTGALPPVGSVSEVDGYRVHVVEHRRTLGHARAVGLVRKLLEIRPEIVYSTVAIGWLPLQAAALKVLLGFKLFTGSHTAASLFPLAREPRSTLCWARVGCLVTRTFPGRLVSLLTEKCYCPTSDCGEIARRFFGVQRKKVVVMHLGVDSQYFYPSTTALDHEERGQLRTRLGISDDEILCINTGKMTERKNPLIVAQAVEQLRGERRKFRSLCIGEGVQKSRIASCNGSIVLDLVHFSELGRYYRAADVGVWPSYESTSMLDAAACGLPLVISDGVVYREHVDGNGRVCREGDLGSLVSILRELESPILRSRLGQAGAEKMAHLFTWEGVAARRLHDFKASLKPATPAGVTA